MPCPGPQRAPQILRGVRVEAAALDRFLSLEIEPAAQHIFDAAALEHAKACRLSAGPAVAAFGIDPVSSNSSTPTTATNTHDNGDDKGDSSGVTAAAAKATPATGVLSDARRRAVKVQVIETQPLPEFSLRAGLAARGGAGAGGASGRITSVYFVGRGHGRTGAGAGGSGDNPRWSLPSRHYRTSEVAGKAGKNTQAGEGRVGMERAAVVPRGAGTLVVATDADNGRSCDGAVEGRTGEAGADGAPVTGCGDGEEAQEEADGEEEEGDWELPLLDGQVSYLYPVKGEREASG